MDFKLFDKRYVYLEWSDELEGKDCIIATTYKDLKNFVNSGDEDRIFTIHEGNRKPFTNAYRECDFCYYDPNLKIKKAWLEGKIIQYHSSFDKWEDFVSVELCDIEEYLVFEWDEYEWRIKPTIKENEKCTESCDNKYVLNMCKSGNIALSISKYEVSNPIYFGDKEKCTHVTNMVIRNFVRDNKKCTECSDLFCYECKELKKFINNINFTRRMTNRELARWIAEGNGESKNTKYCTVCTSYNYVEGTENEEVGSFILIRDFGSNEWREPLIEV